MHKIDGYGHSANTFTEGDPANAVPATVVTDDWLNDVQGELAGAVEAGGQTLEKGVAQLTWLGKLARHGSGPPPAGTYSTWCLWWDEAAGPGDALAYVTFDAGATWYPCLLVSLDPVS